MRCSGQTYAVGDVLFLKRGETVQCGALASFRSKRRFTLDLFETQSYDSMRNVYRVKRTGETLLTTVNDLATYHAAAEYREYVVLMCSVSGFSSTNFSDYGPW